LKLELVVVDRLLEATTKKRVINFFRKKVHPPPDKILAMPMIILL